LSEVMATAAVFCDLRPTGHAHQPGIVPRRERTALSGLAAAALCEGFRAAQCFGCWEGHSGQNQLKAFNARRDAAHALRWIRTRSRWTDIDLDKRLRSWGSPAPPKSVRSEYVLSFSWCCEILGLHEAETRRSGLPIRDSYSTRPHGGLANWRRWRSERGIPRPSPEFLKATREREARAEQGRLEKLANPGKRKRKTYSKKRPCRIPPVPRRLPVPSGGLP